MVRSSAALTAVCVCGVCICCSTRQNIICISWLFPEFQGMIMQLIINNNVKIRFLWFGSILKDIRQQNKTLKSTVKSCHKDVSHLSPKTQEHSGLTHKLPTWWISKLLHCLHSSYFLVVSTVKTACECFLPVPVPDWLWAAHVLWAM